MAVDVRELSRRGTARPDPRVAARATCRRVDGGGRRRRRREASRALRGGLDYSEWCVRLRRGRATRRPTWPAEYGAGLSLPPGQAKHVNEVLNRYKVPRPFNIIGIGMGGPTVIDVGDRGA